MAASTVWLIPPQRRIGIAPLGGPVVSVTFTDSGEWMMTGGKSGGSIEARRFYGNQGELHGCSPWPTRASVAWIFARSG